MAETYPVADIELADDWLFCDCEGPVPGAACTTDVANAIRPAREALTANFRKFIV
jgi:hypothetical protein